MNSKNQNKTLRRFIYGFIAICFLLFPPLRFILFPESGGYYVHDNLDKLLFVCCFLLFPFASAFLITLTIPSFSSKFLNSMRYILVFALPLSSVVLYFISISQLNAEIHYKISKFEKVYEPKLNEISEKIKSAKFNPLPNKLLFKKPYLAITDCNNIPHNIHDTCKFLFSNWVQEIFGSEVFYDLHSYNKHISNFPDFYCATAFLIVSSKEKSGRMIEIDPRLPIKGAVPEILWYSKVYAFNVEDNNLYELPKKIYGAQAELPRRKLGGGVQYISFLEGEKPKQEDVTKYIESFMTTK